MRIALIADTFPPLRTSGAVQLRDLAREFVRQGHQLTVMLPSSELEGDWMLEYLDGVQVLRLRAPRIKDVGYLRRTLGEFMMPFAMRRHLRKTPLSDTKWDGVVWYAPSIFHGPLAATLKEESGCKGYLIIRDIFPDWAVDMELMSPYGLPYQFFSSVARYQYSVADVIGVQTPGNLGYFSRWHSPERRVEVLPNWLSEPSTLRSPIRIRETPLAGRRIFVYAGNMGIAQGMEILIELAERLRLRKDVGFLFVGRGTDAKRLASLAARRQLDNVLFHDEIHPDEVPDLYAQCHIGLVALDSRHKSHNIPGKFLTYMQSGLPVLANINRGNDLAELIRVENVGMVSEANAIDELQKLAEQLLKTIAIDSLIGARCKSLFARQFSCEITVNRIVGGLLDAPTVHSSTTDNDWEEQQMSLPVA